MIYKTIFALPVRINRSFQIQIKLYIYKFFNLRVNISSFNKNMNYLTKFHESYFIIFLNISFLLVQHDNHPQIVCILALTISRKSARKKNAQRNIHTVS